MSSSGSMCYDGSMGNREREPDRQELLSLGNVLAGRFIQRRDLYARQLDDGSYVCVRKPLQGKHLVAHLRGELTLGAYALNREGRGRFLVLDADTAPDYRRLRALSRWMAAEGDGTYLENSRRGGHLWLFFAEPLPGETIRRVGQGLLTRFGIEGVELFPKQDRLTSGPGSLIRLPFGVHRKSGRRYGFYHPSGQPLAPTLRGQVQALGALETLSKRFLEDFQGFSPLLQGKRPSGEPRKPLRAHLMGDQEVSLSERIKGAVSVRQLVLRHVELSPSGKGLCPLHDDHHESFSVSDDKNLWHCFTCEKGGSVIDLYMALHGCDFSTAVSELAGQYLGS